MLHIFLNSNLFGVIKQVYLYIIYFFVLLSAVVSISVAHTQIHYQFKKAHEHDLLIFLNLRYVKLHDMLSCGCCNLHIQIAQDL